VEEVGGGGERGGERGGRRRSAGFEEEGGGAFESKVVRQGEERLKLVLHVHGEGGERGRDGVMNGFDERRGVEEGGGG